MQIKLRLIRIIAIAVLATSGMLCIALLELFGRNTEQLQMPIPKEAEWVIRADAAALLKEEALTILFEEQDDQLIRTLRSLAEEKIQTAESPKLYINIFSEMVAFGTSKDGHRFTGLLLKLDNVKQFSKNITHYLKENQSFAIVENTGLILTRVDDKIYPSQQQYTETLLKNSSNVYLTERERAPNEWIRLETKKATGTVQNADVGMFFDKHQVSINGQLKLNKEPHAMRYDLKQEGFYFNSAFVPENLPEIMLGGLQLDAVKFPPLANLTLNYKGIVIENGSSMFRLPKINAILTTVSEVRVEDIMKQVPEQSRKGNGKLQFGSKTYYLKQLDPKTIFFGLDPSTILKQAPSGPLIVQGDPAALASIEADAMIMAGISILMPQFNAVNSFAQQTDKISLDLVRDGDHYEVKGSLSFKESSSALATMTRLLLNLQVVQ